jgi:hypothetical protein
MEFVCKEIELDKSEFGITITLYDKLQNHSSTSEQSIDEIMTELGTYIMLQRTFGDDENDSDYCTFECSDFDLSRELVDCEFLLSDRMFAIKFIDFEFSIDITEQTKKRNALKEMLEDLVVGSNKLIIK